MYEKPTYEELERRVQELEKAETERKQTEKSLRDSEKKYRALFENMAQGVFYQRADGVLFDYNNAALELFGLTSDQFIGKTSLDQQWKVIDNNGTVLPGDKHPSMVALQTGKAVRDNIVGVYNPRRKDYNWLLVNAIPQFSTSGEKPDQVFVTIEDITERKQAEENLEKSLSLIEATMSSLEEGLLVVSMEGKIIRHNRAFLDLWKIPPELESSSDEMLLEYVVSQMAYPKAFLSKVTQLYEMPEESSFDEVAFTDGRVFERFSQPLWQGSQITGRIWCFRNITKRKQAEKDLRIAHEKMLTILDSIDSTVYVADMDTHEILFMNKEMIAAFGGDKTGEKCFRALSNKSEPCRFCNNDRLVDADGRPVGVLTWQNRNKITDKHYINHDQAIEWADGRLVRMQIATDITDLKKMEAQLNQIQKMESIGTLAGGIAHDFNNILYPIIGHAEMLLNDIPEEGSIRDSLNQIYSSSLRARDLVQQILAFARQEKNELTLMKMQPIIKEAMKLIRSTIPASIAITQNLQSDCRPVSADPTQIHQIVMNLATNAYHAMEENGGELKVDLKEIELGEDDLINPDKFDLVITDIAMPKMSGDKLAVELFKIRPDIPVLLCTGFSETMTDEKMKSLGIKGILMKPIVIKELAKKIRELLDNVNGPIDA